MKNVHHLKKLVNNQQGIGMVLALMLTVVVSVMGLSVLGLTATNNKQSTGERDYQSTYFIAESGANYRMKQIHSSLMEIYDNSTTASQFFQSFETQYSLGSEITYSDFEPAFGKQPVAKIIITRVNSNTPIRQYKLSSKGTIGDRTRTVERTFSLTWNTKTSNNATIPTDTGVFVTNTIKLDGGAMVTGGVGTNASTAGAITLLGGSSISGPIYVGPSSGSNVINKPDYISVSNPIKLPAIKTFSLPPFPVIPTYPTLANTKAYSGSSSYDVIQNGALRVDNWIVSNYTLNMTQNLSLNSIRIASGYQLNINVGSENRSLVVNNLDMPNGFINIAGTGKLTIYVTGNMTMDSGSIINTGQNINKLDIYLKGSGIPTSPKSLSIAGAQKIYGSLYAEDANLSLGGGSGFQGHIVTGGKNVTIDGGASAISQLIYAPNATFLVSGGATVKGSIVAKSLTADGGSRIQFTQINNAELPFFPGNDGGTAELEDLILTNPIREK